MTDVAKRLAPAGSGPIDVFLRPGQYFVGDHRHQIRTVLGSCVSITLWQPQQRMGAMCHFLLSNGCGHHASHVLDARHGEGALRLTLRELVRVGVDTAGCVAQILGGGISGDQQATGAAGALAVTRQHAAAVRGLLEQMGISILSEHLVGERRRQIIFDVGSGAVGVQPLLASGRVALLDEVFA